MVSIEQIRAAGVVGAGGAGFPTHVKLSGRADTVLLNAAECEPLMHKDQEVMGAWPQQVLAGLTAAMRLVGASRGVIGIKGKHRELIDQLGRALPAGVAIAPLRDSYPAGDEFVLVYDVLGRLVPPGGLPLDVQAVVINVETAWNVAAAGERPVTEKFLTVAGSVARPVTLRVPIGMTLGQCVAAAGGATCPEAALLVGGAMMGRLAEGPDELVDKTTGGLIVLPAGHPLVAQRRRDARQAARIGRSACDQCSFCTELCPRYLLGHPIEPHRVMRNLMFDLTGGVVAGAAFCCECNLCSLFACPEQLDPKRFCADSKRWLAERGERKPQPPFNPRRAALHLADRRIPIGRLMRKLGLASFNDAGPLACEPVAADRVGIKLKQHVGRPCEPTVAVGQTVRVGEPVGRPPTTNGRPALGAPVHASISGTVVAIGDGVVWIERR